MELRKDTFNGAELSEWDIVRVTNKSGDGKIIVLKWDDDFKTWAYFCKGNIDNPETFLTLLIDYGYLKNLTFTKIGNYLTASDSVKQLLYLQKD